MAKPVIDHRDQLARLRRGIGWAWFLNVLWLSITTEAAVALMLIYQGYRGTGLLQTLLVVSPAAIALSLLTVWLVSVFSWKAIQARASRNMRRVGPRDLEFRAVEEAVVGSGAPLTMMPAVYVAEDQMEPNAFALSSPKGSMIVFTRGLLELLDDYEIRAVAAHEWGHIMSGDSKAMTKLIALSNVIGMIQGLFLNGMINVTPRGNSNNQDSGPAGTIITIAVAAISVIVLLMAPLMGAVLSAFMSRKRESNADACAVEYTRNPAALATALQKISGQNVHDPKFHAAVGQLAFFSQKTLATHPPVEQRVADLERMSGLKLQ